MYNGTLDPSTTTAVGVQSVIYFDASMVPILTALVVILAVVIG